jgi:myosin heavy subunit
MDNLGYSQQVIKDIFRTLAIVLHLGNIEFVKVNEDLIQIEKRPGD